MHLIAPDIMPLNLGGSISIFQDIRDLRNMSRNEFAKRAIEILQFAARQWQLAVSLNCESDQNNELERAWRPLPGSMNFFCPTGAVLLVGNVHLMDFAFFAPFPMQGQPSILFDEPRLKSAGFILATELRSGPNPRTV
jgi:hypothetical protein